MDLTDAPRDPDGLSGRTAAITGGASGIGAACALLLASSGVNIVIADISRSPGELVAESVRAHGVQSTFVQADVRNRDACEGFIGRAVGEYGPVEIAINAAGITGGANAFVDIDVDDWLSLLDVNLSGIFYSMQAELRHMRTLGRGAIVNIASILGSVAPVAETCAGYTATKHGVVGLTRAAAVEYAPEGIRVNSVGPGYVLTPMLEGMGGSERAAITALHPMKRLGTANEIAALVAFLVSRKASFITGVHYHADGGYTAQ